MIDLHTVLAIVLMALATFLTRILGYLLLRKRNLSARTMKILDVVPGCVLISVIAPAFVSDRPANLIALTITLITATRLPLLPTVVVAIASTGLLRQLIH